MRGSKVVINRAALDAVKLASADGLFEVGKEILDVVSVPDAPPKGQGLIQGGGVVAWFGSKKVADSLIGGRAIKKPRGLKMAADGATAAVGFGFPARFVELGTVDTPAEPFFTGAVNQVAPHAKLIISKKMADRLAGMRKFGGRT